MPEQNGTFKQSDRTWEQDMMRRLDMIFLGFAVWVCVTAMGCSDVEQTKEIEVTVESQKTWELPEGMCANPIFTDVDVSPTGSHVCFQAWNPKSNWLSAAYAILDTRSGKVERVSSLCKGMESGKGLLGFKGWDSTEFSRNGKDLLVNGRGKFPVTKINLATGRTTEILDTPFPRASRAWWFGDDVAVFTADHHPDGRTCPVRIISSEGTPVRTLPVYGKILAADRNGRFLVVIADPNNLTRPILRKRLPAKAHILVVNAEGKKLWDLGPKPKLASGTYVIVSPSGAYIAFLIPSSQKETDEGKTATKVVSMLDGSQRNVVGGVPISLTDRGELLTEHGDVVLEINKPFDITNVFKLSSVDGKMEVFRWKGIKVGAASIANDRLYYLSVLANGRLGISWTKFR